MNESVLSKVKKFQFERVLSSDTQEKTVALLGRVDGKMAIFRFEKTPYDTAQVEQLAGFVDTDTMDVLGDNDIYSWLLARMNNKEFTDKVSIVHPATAKHVSKYEETKSHMVRETWEAYESKVKPYIATMRGERLEWVRNILFKGAEAEAVLYRDDNKETGFVLLPDMKWDRKTMQNLNIICIVNREDIASVRDLDASHMEWLTWLNEQILTRVPALVQNKLHRDELRVFVHYHPSYYHFHVHIVNANHKGLGTSITAGRAILLEEVIETLRFGGYQNRAMTFILPETDKLYKLLTE